MTEYGKSLGPNVDLVMVDSKEDTATQLGQVENFISQKMDAIVLVPTDTDATEPMTQAAQAAGIPLVYVNRFPTNLPDTVAYVGSDSIQAGIMQMEWLADKLGGKGNVVIMEGELAQEAAQKRTKGVEQVAGQVPRHQDHQEADRRLGSCQGPDPHGELARLRRPDRRRRLQQRRNGASAPSAPSTRPASSARSSSAASTPRPTASPKSTRAG